MTRQIKRQMITRKRGRDIDQEALEAILELVQAPEKYGASEIRRRLLARINVRGELVFEGRVPELRTMQRVVRDMGGRLTLLDTPFQWHRLEEYELPWEAGGYLMDMWVFVKEHEAMLHRDYAAPAPIPPTVRQARWWWRVNQLVPEVETKLDIHVWAGEFVHYELFKDILGKPQDVSGLEAYLAYKPWVSQAACDRYTVAVNEGRIPHMPVRMWTDALLVLQLRKVAKYADTEFSGIDVVHPCRLPSVSYMELLAELKPLREETRELERENQELKRQQTEKEDAP